MPREIRRGVPIAGIGGFLMPWIFNKLQLDNGQITPNACYSASGGVFLDVGRWVGEHTMILTRTTGSGSNGAIQRALVAQDFHARAQLSWDARRTRIEQRAWGFLENMLIGVQDVEYNIALLLQLGAPGAYGDPGHPAGGEDERAFMFIPEILLERVRMINDGTGTDVVRAEVELAGNSLVQGWRGTTQMFNVINLPAQEAAPNG